MDARNSSDSQGLFAGDYLDRRAGERAREDWLQSAAADPDTRFLVLRAHAALVHHVATQQAHARLALLDAQHPLVISALRAGGERHALLGWFRGTRCVLLDIDAPAQEDLPGDARFEELRPLAAAFSRDEAALFAYARALAHWRATHRFCGRCATALQSRHAGHSLRCPACGEQSFPRLDPAIIVLVHSGAAGAQRALLGRQASWPPGRYSTIAGFVEPGEALEDAVRREVGEETGVLLQQVSYFASQPWPFPASLMLGFFADAATGQAPRAHDGELEDVRWFTPAELRAGAVLLPPSESISRQLIEHWLHLQPSH